MARSIDFNRAHSPSLLGICRASIIFSSERFKCPTVEKQICICNIGLHADQFRNRVYSYGANLFFTRHKPYTSLALSHFGIF